VSNEASAPVRDARDVSPHEWGKVLLEELLFQAAEQISKQGANGDSITLSLPFTLKANQRERCLEISTPGKVEQAIVTRVPMR
jgi:hypothetical protein